MPKQLIVPPVLAVAAAAFVAAATVTTEQRVAGRWRRTGARRLPGTYLWHTVTGPRAVCRLEFRTTKASAGFPPSAVVQLLVSPSIGCGRAHGFVLERGA